MEDRQCILNNRFTLVELVVVLSVMSILASMLCHVMILVKNSEKDAKCKESLRRVAVAEVEFSSDNNGWSTAASDELVVKDPFINNWGSVWDAVLSDSGYIPRDVACGGCPVYYSGINLKRSYSHSSFTELVSKEGVRPYKPGTRKVDWPMTVDAYHLRFSSSLQGSSPSDILLITDQNAWSGNSSVPFYHLDKKAFWDGTAFFLPEFLHINDTKNVLFLDGHVEGCVQGTFEDGLYRK